MSIVFVLFVKIYDMYLVRTCPNEHRYYRLLSPLWCNCKSSDEISDSFSDELYNLISHPLKTLIAEYKDGGPSVKRNRSHKKVERLTQEPTLKWWLVRDRRLVQWITRFLYRRIKVGVKHPPHAKQYHRRPKPQQVRMRTLLNCISYLIDI